MKTPDILNSKIKKLRIELPHYNFSHSSSGDSHNAFIGRERIREKLKKVIENSPDEPGVYLIAGNRGVGKTTLVSEVIKETSLKTNSSSSKNLKYLILLLFFVAGIQFCLQIFNIPNNIPWIISSLIFFSSFILLCFFNGYRRKFPEQTNWKEDIKDGIISAIRELSYLKNPYNPYGRTQYVLKIILIVSFTQIISIIFNIITPTIVLFSYLLIIFGYNLFRFINNKLYEYKQKYGTKKSLKENIRFLLKIFLIPIWNYIKNRDRLYLRINFGHKLKDEKDILRLIARTLNTEYHKYRYSFWRMLPWRTMAFVFLFLSAYLFSPIVAQQEFYKKLIKEAKLYKASSQILLEIPTSKKDDNRLDGVFSKKDTIITKVKTIENGNGEIQSKRKIQKPKLYTEVGNVGNYLLAIDQLIFEITKIVKKTPQYLLKGKVSDDFFRPINYLCVLLFTLMYLFCTLLFHCVFITYFFVTHRIIIQRLKKLNNDITHSTERENSIGIAGYNSGIIGPGVLTKTKKSRNVADAREIEKELQDILSDMQRIPVIMCRPNIVIVFDELDKVEPSDTNSEKENTQTKDSLFSIGATRERQTEILRILSNMKYFLSTAKAKFIFIAGREMFDIHLADVSERNNYIGSIFNVVIHVPSFLTDHPTGKESIPEESSIASLPEEFVCRRLIPHDYKVKSYNLKKYKIYLENEIYKSIRNKEQEIEKIIAVLQQFIIYLAHVSKGAPKKMMQLFESFVEIRNERDRNREDDFLIVQRYHSSRHFLSFNYYKQYTVGIIAYLITPIFYLLAESNIKELSDKLLVSSLRFVDFLFKFHKQPFLWKHLDISPEMLEVNRAPELKSVAVYLLNYLTQIHINKSNFSLSEYKFDSWIANEIFAMTKTDEVFSALFSFSLDETLPLKKHYLDLLEKAEKKYREIKDNKTSTQYIDAISSLQVVLGDLHYYDDELEEAEVYYKSTVQALRQLEEEKRNKRRKNSYKAKDEKEDDGITPEQFYRYVRNMLRLGMIYEKRKQYDFAYMTYSELCKRIIEERNITINKLGAGIVLRKNKEGEYVFVKASTVDKKEEMYYDNIETPTLKDKEDIIVDTASPQPLYFEKISPNTNDALFKKMTYEGLKMLYLPFIAKLQILEQSHMGGITYSHLVQLDKEFEFLTYIIDHNGAKLLEAEFYSRVADILYYKNSDLKKLKCGKDKNEGEEYAKNFSCTACFYYQKALSTLLNKSGKDTVIKLLHASIEQINGNCDMKFCTILARILSDWGNVFFSCDNKHRKNRHRCDTCDAATDCNTQKNNLPCAYYIYDTNDCETNRLKVILDYVDSESKKENRNVLLKIFVPENNLTKMEISFAMYAISLHAYRKADLYKRSASQIYKMLSLFKHYEIYNENYIEPLSKKAIHYLLYANDDLNILELNKRKKDLGEKTMKKITHLQNLLLDSEITKIRILVKELELKFTTKEPKDLKKYYYMRITSPYKINYSIGARIYRLRLKSIVNNEAYQMLIPGLTKLITEYNNDFGDKSVLYSKLIDMDAIYDKDDDKFLQIKSEIKYIFNALNDEKESDIIEKIFDEKKSNDEKENRKKKVKIFENLIADTIYCLIDIVQLSETMDETYIFTHSFLASIHKDLSLWIRRYEIYEIYIKENSEIEKLSQIKEYLKKYLDLEWREMLSGYRENQRALSHYYKSLEMHNEGRSYHNMIDTMCYVRDDYNDRSDHFNIAEERHLIVNKEIENKIDDLKNLYEKSELYDVNNYFEKV